MLLFAVLHVVLLKKHRWEAVDLAVDNVVGAAITKAHAKCTTLRAAIADNLAKFLSNQDLEMMANRLNRFIATTATNK